VISKDTHIQIDGYQLVGGLGSVGTYTCELVDSLIAEGCRITLAIPRKDLNSLGLNLIGRHPDLQIVTPETDLHPDTSYSQLLVWNHQSLPKITAETRPHFHISVYHHTPGRMPPGTKRITVIHDCCGLRTDSGYTLMGRAMLRHWSHLKSAAMFADSIIPISKHTRSAFLKHFPSAAAKTRQPIYNCVSAKTIDSEKACQLLNTIGLKPGSYLLGLGMASKRKGMDMMMRGYSEYRNQSGDLPLVLYGGGNMQPSDWGLDSRHADHLRKLGRISDELRDALFSGAVAFLFPSRCEGFGYPIVEAAKQGCPIIAWKMTTAAEILPEEDWLNNLCPEEIAESILRAQAMTSSERTAKRHNLIRQADRFAGKTLASEYMKIFEDL
jgi:glycosyltransferase involved in cell wall biosynthesis